MVENSQEFTTALNKFNVRRLVGDRQTQRVKILDPVSDPDDEGPELFTAQPSDDIPRNKLTEKLARGLQSFVQRMQKRECFYAELSLLDLPIQAWIPAPREYSTLTCCNDRAYLIGGQNYDTNKEVAQLHINKGFQDSESHWTNIDYSATFSTEKINGRCRHSSAVYKNKIYSFGGSYMYNRKR